MPYARRRKSRKSRRSRRKVTAGGPRLMGRGLKHKRFNQVDVRPFWFKFNSTINWFKEGNHVFTIDAELYNISQFRLVLPLYDEYKVMGFVVRLFPANVGIESADPTGQGRHYSRGNHILMSDQNWPSGGAITSISSVINQASAKMISSRHFHKRAIFRPYGLNTWTTTEQDSNGLVEESDPWSPAISLYHEDASDTIQDPDGIKKLWYYTIQYKVLFRGRKQDPP